MGMGQPDGRTDGSQHRIMPLHIRWRGHNNIDILSYSLHYCHNAFYSMAINVVYILSWEALCFLPFW